MNRMRFFMPVAISECATVFRIRVFYMLKYFDFSTFIRIFYKSFSRQQNIAVRFNAKRIVFLVIFYIIFPLIEIFNAICFKLDDLFFPEYRHIDTSSAVFILGNPRSGTTFIHRLMSIDNKKFFCFKTWEIIFPSIVQKKVLLLFGWIDQKLGSPIYRLIQKREKAVLQNFNQMHPTGLFYPEECELLLIHIFATYNLLFLFPLKGEFSWFQSFDQSLPDSDKNKIMSFYSDCIERQARYLSHRGNLLSKSPAFSSKIDSLFRHFPNCKIVYMVRSPLEVVPSVFSFVHGISDATSNFIVDTDMYENVYEMTKEFYNYPLLYLAEKDPSRYAIVNYDDLVSRPSEVIISLYNRFGFELSPNHLQLLKEEDNRAKKYNSAHKYSLDRFDLKEEKILQDFKNIFDRFYPGKV